MKKIKLGIIKASWILLIITFCNCDWVGSSLFSCTLDCLDDPFEEDDDNNDKDDSTVEVLDDSYNYNDDSLVDDSFDYIDDSVLNDTLNDTDDSMTSAPESEFYGKIPLSPFNNSLFQWVLLKQSDLHSLKM